MPKNRAVITALLAGLAIASCKSSPDQSGEPTGNPSRLEKFAGDSQISSASTVLVTPLAIRVLDAQGLPVSGTTVAWAVDSGGGIVTPATSITDPNGRASTIFTLGAKLGVQSVHATVTSVSGNITFIATVFPTQWSGQIPTRVALLAGNNQVGSANVALTHPLIVTVTDVAGDPVSGIPVSFTTTGGAVAAPATTVSDALGRATTVLTLGPGVGLQNAQATALNVVTTASFTAVATGTPATIELNTGMDQTGAIGAVLGQPITVKVRDAQSNLVPNALVTWSVTGGGGSVSPPVLITGGNDGGLIGQANATWKLGPLLGQQTVTASIASGASVTFRATGVAATPVNAPILVASIVPPSGATYYHDTFVRDGLAFSAIWNQGLVIYDVGNGRNGGSPPNPKVVSQIVPSANGVVGGPATHNSWWFHNPVTGEKRYAFVGQEGPMGIGSASSGDIHIIDVADLAHPVEVGFFHVAGAGAHNFWMDEPNQVLYAAFYNGGIAKIDVSGVLSGDMSGRIVARVQPAGAVNTYTWGVMLAGGTLYASDMLSGFWALDPVTLVTRGGGNNVIPRLSTDLWVAGNVAYSGTYPRTGVTGNSVRIWSLGANGVPTIADSLAIPGVGAISDVAVTPDGKMLVVTTEGSPTGAQGLYVFDRTVNPFKPVLVGTYPVSTGLHTGDVAVIGGRTYVFAARNPGQVQLDIYDITDLVH